MYLPSMFMGLKGFTQIITRISSQPGDNTIYLVSIFWYLCHIGFCTGSIFSPVEEEISKAALGDHTGPIQAKLLAVYAPII